MIIHKLYDTVVQLPMRKFFLIGLFLALAMLTYGPVSNAYVFQSPLPEPTRPQSWIQSTTGGTVRFGPVTVLLPPNFTNQSGANVFGNLANVSQITKPASFILGTEFTFGIWPVQNQRDYQKPIEFRITINAAEIPGGSENQIILMMYDPVGEQWVETQSKFQPETYQIFAYVQSFRPVPDDFPAWGGRTFFGLFLENSEEIYTPVADESPSIPYVNRSSNLRAGPGTNFPIVGSVAQGMPLVLKVKTENGQWYQLENGSWIAAFLINNAPEFSLTTALPTSTPRSGLLKLADKQVADFDNEKLNDLDNGDILLIQVSEDQLYLVPLNGTKLAMIGERQIEISECDTAAFDISVVPLQLQPASVYLCIISNENRIVRVELRRADKATLELLNFAYVIWKED